MVQFGIRDLIQLQSIGGQLIESVVVRVRVQHIDLILEDKHHFVREPEGYQRFCILEIVFLKDDIERLQGPDREEALLCENVDSAGYHIDRDAARDFMIDTSDQFSHGLLVSENLSPLGVFNYFLLFCDRSLINGTCPCTNNNAIIAETHRLHVEFRVEYGLLRVH